MTDADDACARLASRLPRHASLLILLRHFVDRNTQLRWLELGCSLGAGEGDEDSDLDIGIGYHGSLNIEQLGVLGESIADAGGPTLGLLTHRMEGWPPEVRRVAVEYANGVQLDLVLLPAEWREGRPDRTVVVVDKDLRLQRAWTPPSSEPPDQGLIREWMFLGWWAISAAAKYIRRGSLFEATESLGEARKHALQLFAAIRCVPYSAFGLVSLLDFPPFELPPDLETTYCDPSSLDSVLSAARAAADLLEQACKSASSRLGVQEFSSVTTIARSRLRDATAMGG